MNRNARKSFESYADYTIKSKTPSEFPIDTNGRREDSPKDGTKQSSRRLHFLNDSGKLFLIRAHSRVFADALISRFSTFVHDGAIVSCIM